ncbi:MAG: dihydroneopterin aldolase [Chloroherpetonaceae bacterium]|nr:dihydroneopterin aldolase [Chthonomonadaceae bacterium]MDW8207542.1 dihydroneopterin aldolase [Chloroherpetonaceae bacterium]
MHARVSPGFDFFLVQWGLREFQKCRFNRHRTMDTIRIQGLEFYAYHGASDAEQRVGHRYRVDVWLGVDTHRASQTDAVEDTVCYAEVAHCLLQVGTERRYHLLEALAARMSDVILTRFPAVLSVRLSVQKIAPPIDAVIGSVGVEIYRERV